jgi:succinoglycan biosynthesis transport protein ExoP
MSEQADHPRTDRSNLRARFHARLSRYRSLLRRRWWVLVLGAILGMAVQGALTRSERVSFSSVGRMIVSIKLNIAEGSVYTEELSNFLGTQASLMQSGVVINRAHKRAVEQLREIKKNPELRMEAVGLKVTVLPKTTIFVLQATGADAEYTQAFLQACMEEYTALKKEMQTKTSDTTVAGLTEEVMRLEKELRQADAELLAFQSTNSVVFSQDQGNNSAANYLAALNQRLATQKSEYELLQLLTVDQSLDRQQGAGGAAPLANGSTDRSSAAGGERADADYFRAKQQLLLMQAEQQELGRYLRTNHPKMVAMSEDIARREQLLKIFRLQSAEQLESRKASLALEIQNLEKDVKEWDGKMLGIQVKSAEFQRLKGNAQRTQALYDRLLATMQTLDVNKEISPESVTIMEAASPAYRDQSDRSRRVRVGGLVGLGLGVLLLLFIDRLDDRMLSTTELKEAFDEEVVGQIPREKSHGRGRQVALVGPADDRHSFVEAYRNLRSSLMYMAEAGAQPKILLVTSSVPDEGKSLTAANLAITMAGAGSRVLLVDTDSRKGALHERFQVLGRPGLTEVLSQGLNWEEVVQATKSPNLFLMPQGSFAPNASELFISGVTKSFLQAAAAKYDYVILDTVPVMAADDVTSLAPHADGVLFVIRAEFTSARVARAALDSLYQRQARVVGLVFNAARPSFEEYYYYRYRGYYRKYPAAGSAAKAETEQAGKA